MTHLDSQDVTDRRTGDPSDYLGIDVFDMFNALDKVLVQRASLHSITSSEYTLLWHCLEGERTATQLARVLPMDGSRISRVVTDLVEKGLLRRRRLQQDRRVVMLSLTQKGMEVASEIYKSMQRFYAVLTEDVSDEDMRAFARVKALVLAKYDSMESQ